MTAQDLNIIVFCGGVGTRLWPVSRQSFPKQFHPLVGGKTLVQNTIYGRLRPDFAWDRIYLSTGRCYLGQVKKQVPEIPASNYILEPEMRDTAPAVGYAVLRVMTQRPGEPIAVLWQDHLIKDTELFKQVLIKAADLVAAGQRPMVYLGTPPRYPSVNLGYLEIGETLEKKGGLEVSAFVGFTEKPDQGKAQQFFKGGKHLWNMGYFVCDPQFLLGKYEEQKNEYNLFGKLAKIKQALGTSREAEAVDQNFPKMDKIAVDYVVHENMRSAEALVVWANFGWSDVGEWRALKEALEENPRQNVVNGRHIAYESEGCLVYSYTDRLVATVGLRDMIIVDTDDVVLVCAAEKAPDVKKLVKKLEEEKQEKYL